MLRALIWIVLLCGVVLVVAPIVLASLYVDQRGVELTGHVYSKSEYVRMLRGTDSWSLSSEVTVEYTLPETGGVSSFNVAMEPEEYDQYHKGQAVNLHYLRREDIPKLPGADIMWQIRILPHVRLAGQRAFAGLRAAISPRVKLVLAAITAPVILLWVWRRSKLPGFTWAVCVCILCVVIATMIYDFPRSTPPPTRDVRVTSGKVKSIRSIDLLFSTTRSRGTPAHQPLDIVGVELVPQGFRDPVLAVDLVDRGSIPGLAEGATVEVDYEAGRPRTAWLRAATRTFPRRNLIGLGADAVLWIGVLVALVLVWHLLGKAFKRFLSRRR